jgi:hypothetical protein
MARDGREAARRIYREFHGRELGRELQVNLPAPPAQAAAIGVVKSIDYEVPWQSDKAGVTWRHRFGDTGHGDTHAEPLLIDGGEGLLYVKSAPGEPPFTVDDYIRG